MGRGFWTYMEVSGTHEILKWHTLYLASDRQNMANHSYIHDVFVLFDSKGLFPFLSSVHVKTFQTHGIWMVDPGNPKTKADSFFCWSPLVKYVKYHEISISLQYFHVRNVEFGYQKRGQWPETSFQSIPFASHVDDCRLNKSESQW